MKSRKTIINILLMLCFDSMVTIAMDSPVVGIRSGFKDQQNSQNISDSVSQYSPQNVLLSVPFGSQNNDQNLDDDFVLEGDYLIANPRPMFLALNLDDNSNRKIQRILDLGERCLNEKSEVQDDYTIKAIFKKDNGNNMFCLEGYKRQGKSQNFHITLHANELNCTPVTLNELQKNINSGNITFRIRKIEVREEHKKNELGFPLVEKKIAMGSYIAIRLGMDIVDTGIISPLTLSLINPNSAYLNKIGEEQDFDSHVSIFKLIGYGGATMYREDVDFKLKELFCEFYKINKINGLIKFSSDFDNILLDVLQEIFQVFNDDINQEEIKKTFIDYMMNYNNICDLIYSTNDGFNLENTELEEKYLKNACMFVATRLININIHRRNPDMSSSIDKEKELIVRSSNCLFSQLSSIYKESKKKYNDQNLSSSEDSLCNSSDDWFTSMEKKVAVAETKEFTPPLLMRYLNCGLFHIRHAENTELDSNILLFKNMFFEKFENYDICCNMLDDITGGFDNFIKRLVFRSFDSGVMNTREIIKEFNAFKSSFSDLIEEADTKNKDKRRLLFDDQKELINILNDNIDRMISDLGETSMKLSFS